MDSETIVVETAERIFADLADAQTIISARGDDWKPKLWQALQDAGLTLAWVPEEHAGSGAALGDGFGALRAAGRAAFRSRWRKPCWRAGCWRRAGSRLRRRR